MPSHQDHWRYYPPIPPPGDVEPSAPPLPGSPRSPGGARDSNPHSMHGSGGPGRSAAHSGPDHATSSGWGWPASQTQEPQPPLHPTARADVPPVLGRGQVLVAPPKLEPQPWVKDLWQRLAGGTVGIVRIDLRRPTLLPPEDYDSGNILLRRRPGAQRQQRGRGRAPVHPATATLRDDWRYYPTPPAPLAPGGAPVYDEPPRARGWGLGLGTPAGQPSGARLKIMRCAQLYADSSAFGGQDGGTSGSDGDGGGATLFQDGKPRRPLLDFGVGASLNLDTQELQGVVRLKLGSLMSLKLVPHPALRIGGCWSLPSASGLALRVRYECPLTHLDTFWAPPARLMVRLDQGVGSGVRLAPGGLEFDERRMALGNKTQLRASALLHFPRQLPLDPEDPDAFKLQVHRLSLKTLW